LRIYTFVIIAIASAFATWISGTDPEDAVMFVLGAGFALLTNAELEERWRSK